MGKTADVTEERVADYPEIQSKLHKQEKGAIEKMGKNIYRLTEEGALAVHRKGEWFRVVTEPSERMGIFSGRPPLFAARVVARGPEGGGREEAVLAIFTPGLRHDSKEA